MLRARNARCQLTATRHVAADSFKAWRVQRACARTHAIHLRPSRSGQPVCSVWPLSIGVPGLVDPGLKKYPKKSICRLRGTTLSPVRVKSV